jgi:hypothetical protein
MYGVELVWWKCPVDFYVNSCIARGNSMVNVDQQYDFQRQTQTNPDSV